MDNGHSTAEGPGLNNTLGRHSSKMDGIEQSVNLR